MRPAVLAIVAACTVGPRYHVPDAPVPSAGNYKEAGRTGPWRAARPSDAMLRGDWWTIFHEPELDALEARVDASNQSIAQAYANYMAALAAIGIARSQYFPTITLSPSATTGKFSSTGFSSVSTIGGGGGGGSGLASGGGGGGGGGTRFTSYSLPLEATWAPDLWGRVRNTVRQARANAQLSAADLENERLLVHATLAQLYFELRGQDALVQLLQQTVATDEQLYETAKARLETGVDTEIATVQAEQTLEAARVQATNAEILRAQYEHAIGTLLGVPATSFSLPVRAVLAAPPPIPVGTPSRLLERRPDIAAAERAMAAANAAVGIGYAAYYPDLTLTATAGLSSSALSSLFSWPSFLWSVGGALAQTIFEGGLRRATIAQAKAQYAAAVANYRQIVLTAFQNVEDELAATSLYATEIQQQTRNVQLAQRAFALEQDRYMTGIDPFIDLMQQQTILLSAQQSLVALQVQQMTAAVALVQALGGGWDRADLPH